MSFFDNLGLAEQVVNDESANIDGGAFPLVNGGTNALIAIQKVEWKTGFTDRDPSFIQVTMKLTDTTFKDCFARCKIHINDNDQKKRQKGANLFSRFYALCNLQPPANLPTDQDLAQFNGLILGCEISYWCMQDKQTGVWTDGNWVGSIFPAQGFVSFDGKIAPADIAKLNSGAVPAQNAPLAPTNQAPINQAPVNQAPINQQPVNQQPVNQQPVNNQPVNNQPVNNQQGIPQQQNNW